MLRQVLWRNSSHGLPSLFPCMLLLACLILSGCDTASLSPSRQPTPGKYTVSSDTIPINHPVTTTGCGKASLIIPGTSAYVTIAAHPAESIGQHTRSYRIHVPKNYTNTRPVAVVLSFHGFTGTGEGMEKSSGFSELADTQDFLAVYPQGLRNAINGKYFWADVGPIDFGVDDVLFVSDILNDLQAKYCVDAHRIYAMGFSNGGGLTYLLACRLAGRVASFGPMSANYYAIPGGCHPGRPVSILNIHGSADPLLPYNGTSENVNPDWPLPPVLQYLQAWATRDGCTSGPTVFLKEPRVTGMQWQDCKGNSSIVHYRIENGGHSWPPLIHRETAAQVLWQFFQAHPLP